MEYVVLWLVLAAVAAMIASSKGRSAFGFFILGLLIPIIGVVAAILTPRAPEKAAEQAAEQAKAVARAEGRVPCPHCAELIMRTAKGCPFCRRDIDQAELARLAQTADAADARAAERAATRGIFDPR